MATGPAIPLGMGAGHTRCLRYEPYASGCAKGICILMRTPTTAIAGAFAVAALPIAAFFAPTPTVAIPTTFSFIAFLANHAARDVFARGRNGVPDRAARASTAT